MLNTMMMLVKLMVATNGASWCQVDSVEAGRAVVVCDGVNAVHAATVDAGFVGPEGTDYGVVWTASVTSREGGALETIKL